MFSFLWDMTISYLLLFLVLSLVLYVYTKEKSFRYYAFYNGTLISYIGTKNREFHRWFDENILGRFFSTDVSESILQHYNWFIQVVFYSIYFLFALYFLDFDKLKPKVISKIKFGFLAANIAFFLLAIFSVYTSNYITFFRLFAFFFIPGVLILALYFFVTAFRFFGSHKKFFLWGIGFYIMFALLAFVLTFTSDLQEPLNFFLIGIIIENICFCLGLAYKVKLINDETINQKNKVVLSERNLEITKLKFLIEGEENERKRIAEDLHDGVSGDLSAIKFQLMAIENISDSPVVVSAVPIMVKMIDHTCDQIRNISHNLSLNSISHFGLSGALHQYCMKMSDPSISIHYEWFGSHCEFSLQKETTIYRIVQELVANIRKHSLANEAWIQCNHFENFLTITVEDNGKGFHREKKQKGIGLQNIESRIKYLDAKFEIESSEKGTCILISIPLK